MHTPYPFEHLPKLTRRQVHALSLMHALSSDVARQEAQRTAEHLLGAPLACSLELPYAVPRGRFVANGHAVWVELEHALWLEIPSGFCELLVERVLGADAATGAIPLGAELDPLSMGALAYLIARVCADTSLRLRGVHVQAPTLTDAELLCFPATLSCTGERALLRAYVPAALLPREGRARPPLRSLPALPLTLWADAGHARLDLGTLRSLLPDDVLVLEHASVARSASGELAGTASVRVQGSATAFGCKLIAGRLEVESIACTWEPSTTRGRRMPDDQPSRTESALARDAPIDVSLELARFQLSLGELERVVPGDVLLTGRRVGELVTLRAAGQAFAEGELVDVEGELGVRITRLLVK
ncbi:MAG TPA: type III secretion system cytoplasmic ring protein SctQ [Polyangiales bacterium]|nr:type III secretion system cytoplasmic ring protein SctQ [Polyangiales bacterium]